jgi:hypothetical protein
LAYSQTDINLRFSDRDEGTEVAAVRLLTLYALEIVLPLLALAIAYVTRRARRLCRDRTC